MFNYIQILTIIIAVTILANLSFMRRRKEISLRRFTAWIILWLGIVFVVFDPRISDSVAVFFGVARGTDAALFIAILLLFYIIFKLFARIETMEQNMTKIVREISLRDGSGKME